MEENSVDDVGGDFGIEMASIFTPNYAKLKELRRNKSMALYLSQSIRKLHNLMKNDKNIDKNLAENFGIELNLLWQQLSIFDNLLVEILTNYQKYILSKQNEQDLQLYNPVQKENQKALIDHIERLGLVGNLIGDSQKSIKTRFESFRKELSNYQILFQQVVVNVINGKKKERIYMYTEDSNYKNVLSSIANKNQGQRAKVGKASNVNIVSNTSKFTQDEVALDIDDMFERSNSFIDFVSPNESNGSKHSKDLHHRHQHDNDREDHMPHLQRSKRKVKTKIISVGKIKEKMRLKEGEAEQSPQRKIKKFSHISLSKQIVKNNTDINLASFKNTNNADGSSPVASKSCQPVVLTQNGSESLTNLQDQGVNMLNKSRLLNRANVFKVSPLISQNQLQSRIVNKNGFVSLKKLTLKAITPRRKFVDIYESNQELKTQLHQQASQTIKDLIQRNHLRHSTGASIPKVTFKRLKKAFSSQVMLSNSEHGESQELNSNSYREYSGNNNTQHIRHVKNNNS